MSGIEVLSLVTEVMTCITFAAETARVCKAIYDGRPTADADLSRKASALKDATIAMETHYRTFEPVSPDERRLADMAQKCHVAANDLQKEVTSIQPLDAKGNLFKSITGSVKSMLGKSKVEKLEQTLAQYETTLQTQILVRLYTRADAAALQESNRFTQLDENVQYLVSQYAASHSRLLDLVVLEHRNTREHASGGLRAIEGSLKTHISNERKLTVDQNQRDRLLRSLKFMGMNERRNLIKQSHEETFSWILQDSETKVRADRNTDDNGYSASDDHPPKEEGPKWPNFIDWLQSESTTYWISGKPGAGKSTLAKFLTERRETVTALDKWRSGTQIISHFFWLLGTELQKSVRGFWCSMVFQQLSTNPHLLDDILNNFEPARTKDEPSDWSDEELRELALRTLKSNASPILFIIDGLDEIASSDGASQFLQAVEDIKKALESNVKFCLASRPEDRFRRAFKDVPELKVHLLTWRDMQKLIEDKLPAHDSPQVSSVANLVEFRRQVINELTDKADGVFMWLVLALESLKRGFENGDSEAEILQRIQLLPKGIEELYADMWKRLGADESIYGITAARYLSLVIARHELEEKTLMNVPPVFLGQMAIAFSPELKEAIFDYDTPFSLATLSERCLKIQREVETRCAGLLVISPDQWRNHPVATTSWANFVHRTLYDYLTTTEHGSQILSACSLTREEAYMMVIHSLLALVCVFNRDDQENLFYLEMYGIRVESFFESLEHLPVAHGLEQQMQMFLKRCSKVYHDGGVASIYTTQDRHTRPADDKIPFLSLALHYEVLQPLVPPLLEDDTNGREGATNVLHDFLETLVQRSTNSNMWPVGRQRKDGFLSSIRKLISLGADPHRAHQLHSNMFYRRISTMTTVEMWMVHCLSFPGSFREEVLLELIRFKSCLHYKTILFLDFKSYQMSCRSFSPFGFQLAVETGMDFDFKSLGSGPGARLALGVDLAFLLSTYLSDELRQVATGTRAALFEVSKMAAQIRPQLLCVLIPVKDDRWILYQCLEPARTGDIVNLCLFNLAYYPRRWVVQMPESWKDTWGDDDYPMVDELIKAFYNGVLERVEGLFVVD